MNELRIHPIPEAYVFSTDGVWRPGVYDSYEACELAATMDDGALQMAMDEACRANPNAVITLAILQALAS